jgi:hypothetical protein
MDQNRPLPSLTPIAQFRVDAGRRWTQHFACLPDSRGGVVLVVVSKRGFRSVGQWAFPNPHEAQRWAEQRVLCNGPFNVY